MGDFMCAIFTMIFSSVQLKRLNFIYLYDLLDIKSKKKSNWTEHNAFHILLLNPITSNYLSHQCKKSSKILINEFVDKFIYDY